MKSRQTLNFDAGEGSLKSEISLRPEGQSGGGGGVRQVVDRFLLSQLSIAVAPEKQPLNLPEPQFLHQ